MDDALAKHIVAGAFEFVYLISIGSLINKDPNNDKIVEEKKLMRATFLQKQSPEVSGLMMPRDGTF